MAVCVQWLAAEIWTCGPRAKYTSCTPVSQWNWNVSSMPTRSTCSRTRLSGRSTSVRKWRRSISWGTFCRRSSPLGVLSSRSTNTRRDTGWRFVLPVRLLLLLLLLLRRQIRINGVCGRFADKLFDSETFRRHGSDVSPTHFGRFADNPSDVSPTNS